MNENLNNLQIYHVKRNHRNLTIKHYAKRRIEAHLRPERIYYIRVAESTINNHTVAIGNQTTIKLENYKTVPAITGGGYLAASVYKLLIKMIKIFDNRLLNKSAPELNKFAK